MNRQWRVDFSNQSSYICVLILNKNMSCFVQDGSDEICSQVIVRFDRIATFWPPSQKQNRSYCFFSSFCLSLQRSCVSLMNDDCASLDVCLAERRRISEFLFAPNQSDFLFRITFSIVSLMHVAVSLTDANSYTTCIIFRKSESNYFPWLKALISMDV